MSIRKMSNSWTDENEGKVQRRKEGGESVRSESFGLALSSRLCWGSRNHRFLNGLNRKWIGRKDLIWIQLHWFWVGSLSTCWLSKHCLITSFRLQHPSYSSWLFQTSSIIHIQFLQDIDKNARCRIYIDQKQKSRVSSPSINSESILKVTRSLVLSTSRIRSISQHTLYPIRSLILIAKDEVLLNKDEKCDKERQG